MYLEKEMPLMFAERPSASSPVSAPVREEKTARTAAAVVTAPPSEDARAVAKPVYDAVKRVFDIFCSFFGLIVLSPLFLVLSIMVAGERSGKGVFYKQKRLGKNGKYIHVYKFRSMVSDADNVEKWLTVEQQRQYYREYKIENDPRVTRIGKLLRRTGLDELPQLFNILRGDLSLVGPRPIQEKEAELYGKDKSLLLSVNPGLTGYWQVYCSGNISYSNKERQKMELYYVEHRSLSWDLKICFATAGAIIRKVKRGQ